MSTSLQTVKMKLKNLNRRTIIKAVYIGAIVLLLTATVVCILYSSAVSAMSCILGLAGIMLSISLTIIMAKWNSEDLQNATTERLRAIQMLSQEQIEANRTEFAKLLNAVLDSTVQQINKIDESKTEQIQQIQQSTETQIHNSQIEFEKLVHVVEASTKEQITAFTHSTKVQLEKMEETTNKHICKLEDSTREQIEKQQKNTLDQIEELKKATEDQITANRTEFKTLVTSIDTATTKHVQALTDSTAVHIQKIEESTERQLAKAEEVTNKQIQKHDENTALQIVEIRKSTMEHITANRKEFEQLILSIAEANAKQLQKMEEEITTINLTSDNQIQSFINQCQDIIYRAEQNNMILCKMLELQLKDSLTQVATDFRKAKAQLAEIEKWELFRFKSTRELQVNEQYDKMQQIQNRMMAITQELNQISHLRIG